MPFVQLAGLGTHYQFSGTDGAVLVLSNSLGTDLSMWDPQMPELGKKFRILRYDTRGHGDSEVTAGDYTIEQLGRDVLQLLDALKVERAHICGLSMGGMIGMWLGIHAPQRLHRMILCNTAARIGSKEMWNARIENVRQHGMKAVAAAVIERWFTWEFRQAAPTVVARAQHMLEESPPEGYVGACAAIRDMDQRDGLSRISVPTLVIAGAKDPVMPLSEVRFVAEQIPNAQFVELDAAHLSNIEQAEQFTSAVSNFLDAPGGSHG